MKVGNDVKKVAEKAPTVDPSKVKVGKDKPLSAPESHEWYPAKFESAESITTKYGPALKFKFELLDGLREDGEPAKGMPVTRFCNTKNTGPSSQLMAIISELSGGKELTEGDEIDLTAYYGHKYEVFIEVTDDKLNPGNRRFKITKIREYGKKKKIKKIKKPVEE